MSTPHVPCPDCGALFPETDGSTHAYLGGSAGCWTAFQALALRELALGIPGPDRLSVHVYAAQHPGLEGRRQAQSVDVHLMVLCWVLEGRGPTAAAVGAMTSWLAGRPAWPWLVRPTGPGPLTVVDIAGGLDRDAHERAVHDWAAAVWASWSPHHAQIRHWLDRGGFA